MYYHNLISINTIEGFPCGISRGQLKSLGHLHLWWIKRWSCACQIKSFPLKIWRFQMALGCFTKTTQSLDCSWMSGNLCNMLALYKMHLYKSVWWVNLGCQAGSLVHCSFKNECLSWWELCLTYLSMFLFCVQMIIYSMLFMCLSNFFPFREWTA